MSQENSQDRRLLRQKLLDWYDQHQRELPWRAKAGVVPNPYHVWLSEIMLQQTTVGTVIPYFINFICRWPTIFDLARADLDEILHAWQGLGYYTRARNLYRCAQKIVDEYQGVFPQDLDLLKKLPGLGPYTIKAVASIAFGKPYVPIDGNIKRVLSRLYATSEDISSHAEALESSDRPGDFAQALMDLGATLCTPRRPNCLICPWQADCKALKAGEPEKFPPKKEKSLKPTRYAQAFILEDPEGALALQKRPEKGLLGGMIEVPTSPWTTEKLPRVHFPFDGNYHEIPGDVRHTFTHFHFIVKVYISKLSQRKGEYFWVHPRDLGKMALPTLMKKIIKHGLAYERNHAKELR